MNDLVKPSQLGDSEIREGLYGPLNSSHQRKSAWGRFVEWFMGPSEQTTKPGPGLGGEMTGEGWGHAEIREAPRQRPLPEVEPEERELPPPLPTAVVHLKTDQVIKGALVSVDRSLLTLKKASLAVSGPSGSINWSPMDGEIVISLQNVDFWQSGLDAVILDRTIDIPVE